MGFLYEYGAPLGGPSGRRSSAIMCAKPLHHSLNPSFCDVLRKFRETHTGNILVEIETSWTVTNNFKGFWDIQVRGYPQRTSIMLLENP